jgi:Domain of unknown function (DUF5668)/B-box zinc finger
MNCANHPDIAAVAYCRTCGKPLCSNCTRDVKGVIYCENCLAERLHGVQPPPPPPGAGYMGPIAVVPSSGPNPALAGILAGFFPFGVGSVYTGQYAKGLAHLLIFVGLIFGMQQHDPLDALCGIAFAFFYVWQIIDAVRTAKALQLGQPAPDPLGLGQAFGAGEKVDTSKVPLAAIILIGIGGVFLLQTMGIFEFSAERLWPLFLIGLGLWLFARRWGWPAGTGRSERDRMRGIMGPVVLVTIGMLSLIESFGGPGWHRTWPVLLLAIGLAQLISRHGPPPLPPPSVGGGPSGAVGGEIPRPVDEVKHG